MGRKDALVKARKEQDTRKDALVKARKEQDTRKDALVKARKEHDIRKDALVKARKEHHIRKDILKTEIAENLKKHNKIMADLKKQLADIIIEKQKKRLRIKTKRIKNKKKFWLLRPVLSV